MQMSLLRAEGRCGSAEAGLLIRVFLIILIQYIERARDDEKSVGMKNFLVSVIKRLEIIGRR